MLLFSLVSFLADITVIYIFIRSFILTRIKIVYVKKVFNEVKVPQFIFSLENRSLKNITITNLYLIIDDKYMLQNFNINNYKTLEPLSIHDFNTKHFTELKIDERTSPNSFNINDKLNFSSKDIMPSIKSNEFYLIIRTTDGRYHKIRRGKFSNTCHIYNIKNIFEYCKKKSIYPLCDSHDTKKSEDGVVLRESIKYIAKVHHFKNNEVKYIYINEDGYLFNNRINNNSFIPGSYMSNIDSIKNYINADYPIENYNIDIYST